MHTLIIVKSVGSVRLFSNISIVVCYTTSDFSHLHGFYVFSMFLFLFNKVIQILIDVGNKACIQEVYQKVESLPK